jgi:endoglucanase
MRDLVSGILLYLALFFCANPALSAETPFQRGFNLTGWLQSSDARAVHFTKFGKEDLQHIKELGADVVRLPINLHAMTDGAPNYELDPLFLFFLDQIVDWSEELGLHLILDNHTFNVDSATDPAIGQVLLPVWTQLAEHFKERSDLVYYEIFNEPHDITDAAWNAIQQEVVTAIRQIDTRHTIIVGPASWNSYNNLALMPAYNDDNLIYTFHFYDPFLFTHQGASWVTPSMVPISGVPFPYDAERMPTAPANLAGTWVGSAFGSYRNEGTTQRVEELLDRAARFAQERDVPVFCGEFGVFIPNSPQEDRLRWYALVRDALEARGIAWTTWDYKGGFGLFERGSSELFAHDLNTPLLRALGLNTPPQTDFVRLPSERGFALYSDFIGARMAASNWTVNGAVDYFSQQDPARGRYCLHWHDVDQYNHFGFDFAPDLDLSALLSRNYALEFWVRGDAPGSSFDIRFMNRNDAQMGQLPWRMRYTVDEATTNWDGQWQRVRLPLAQFSEHGAWDGEFHTPEGLFDWTAIDRLEMVAEHHDLVGRNFYFDDLRLVGDDDTAIALGELAAPDDYALEANYPNPFNASTTIRYQLPTNNSVQLAIYNMAGQKIRTLIDAEVAAGWHALAWDGRDETGQHAASGVYFYQLLTSDFLAAGKMTLLR